MHYILAGFMKILSIDNSNILEKAWQLRLLFIIFPLLSVVFMYYLAKRFTKSPGYVTMLFIVTPVFWVTSISLLIDTVLLTFFLAAMVVFFKSQENDGYFRYILCGLLAGMAFLVKYTGISVLAVITAYLLLNHKKIRNYSRVVLIYIMWLLVFVIWYWVNMKTYGSSHFFSSLKVDVVGSGTLWIKIVSLLIFFSGSLIFPVFSFAFAAGKKYAVFLIVSVSGLMLLFLSPQSGGFTFVQSCMNTMFILTTITFLYIIILLFLRFKNSLNTDDIFVACWLGILFLMMLKTMNWLAVRYFLLFIPPAVILFIRIIELRGSKKTVVVLSLIITFIFGFSVTYSDYIQAGVCKRIDTDLSAMKLNASGKWFYGNSFLGYYGYLTHSGWLPANIDITLKKNDLFIVPAMKSFPIGKFGLPKIKKVKLLNTFEYNTRFPVRIMNNADCAGLYCSFFGNLPFSFSNGPLEKFYLYRVEK